MADVDSKPALVPAWRAWFSIPRLRWLVPASAAAIALVLYVAVKPLSPGLGDQGQPTPVAAPAPEFTVARQFDHAAPMGREATGARASNAAPVLPQAARQPVQQPAEAFSAFPEKDDRRQSLDTSDRSTRLGEVLPSKAAPVNAPVRARPDAPQPPVTTDLQARSELAAPSAMAPQPPAPAAKPTAVDSRPAAPLVAGIAPTPSTLERPTLAVAVPPSDPPGASARAAAANRSAITVAETRAKRDIAADAAGGAAPARAREAAFEKRVVTVDVAHVAMRYDVDSLWNAAEFVVRARAVAPHPAVLVRRHVASNLEAVEPIVSADFDVVEVFKRLDSVIPAAQFVMGQAGSEAEDDATIYRVPDHRWVRIASGGDYVLFLTRSQHPATPNAVTPFAGPRGIYRLQGEDVVVGNGDERVAASSTSDLLAKLRRLAGTARH